MPFGIPGGKGPNQATEFVVQNGPFADSGPAFRHLAHLIQAVSIVALGFFPAEEIKPANHDATHLIRHAAVGGHFITPHTRLQITRAEPQPPLIDHCSKLFFGRTTPVTAQIRQPFFWQPPQKIDEPEQIAWRADHNLHRYRTTYQTVGQPFTTWPKYKQPDFEQEIIRPVSADLTPFRGVVAFGTYWVWTGENRVDVDVAEVIKPPVTDLFPYRQITITAGPGQPWYFWQPIKITIDPEEQMFRTNHDIALYMLRPHDAVPPAPPATATTIYPIAMFPIGMGWR